MDADRRERLRAALSDLLKENRVLEISLRAAISMWEARLSSVRQLGETLESELLELDAVTALERENATRAAVGERGQPLVAELLLELLRRSGSSGQTTKELERQAAFLIPEIAHGTVRSTLSKLEKAGKVAHPSRGRWCLRPKAAHEPRRRGS